MGWYGRYDSSRANYIFVRYCMLYLKLTLKLKKKSWRRHIDHPTFKQTVWLVICQYQILIPQYLYISFTKDRWCHDFSIDARHFSVPSWRFSQAGTTAKCQLGSEKCQVGTAKLQLGCEKRFTWKWEKLRKASHQLGIVQKSHGTTGLSYSLHEIFV